MNTATNPIDSTTLSSTGYYNMDKKYFFQTLPRGFIPTHHEIELNRIMRQAELNSNIGVDLDLVGCHLIILYRHHNYRLHSKCLIHAVQDTTFRSFSGKWENLVDLERSDGSMCQIGLSLTDYWTVEHEVNGKDYVWFIGEFEPMH